mgnify:CR=1 FL=1
MLPLGATMNMSGTALYEGCVVLFVAQVFGVHVVPTHWLFTHSSVDWQDEVSFVVDVEEAGVAACCSA